MDERDDFAGCAQTAEEAGMPRGFLGIEPVPMRRALSPAIAVQMHERICDRASEAVAMGSSSSSARLTAWLRHRPRDML